MLIRCVGFVDDMTIFFFLSFNMFEDVSMCVEISGGVKVLCLDPSAGADN